MRVVHFLTSFAHDNPAGCMMCFGIVAFFVIALMLDGSPEGKDDASK